MNIDSRTNEWYDAIGKITERVKIIVETMDFKYAHETDIVSDGSFDGVNKEVGRIVYEAFKDFPLTFNRFYWTYVQGKGENHVR